MVFTVGELLNGDTAFCNLKSASLIGWQGYLVAQQPSFNFSLEFLTSKGDIRLSYLICRLFLTKNGKKCALLMQQAGPAWFTAIWSVCSIWERCELNIFCLFAMYSIHYLKGRSWQSDYLLPFQTEIKLPVLERLFSQKVMPAKEVLGSDVNSRCARSATSSPEGWCCLAFVALSFIWPLMPEEVAGVSASLIISDMWLALANLLKRMCLLCSRLVFAHGRGISTV